MRWLAALLLLFVAADAGAAALCDSTYKDGLIAMPDLGVGTYDGMVGGLYGSGGVNYMPHAYLQTCLDAAESIVPLDTDGNPDYATGLVEALSIGYSFSQHATGTAFQDTLAAEPGLKWTTSATVGGVGGTTLTRWADRSDTLISYARGTVDPDQVQVIFSIINEYESSMDLGGDPSDWVDSCAVLYDSVMVVAQDSFPNLKLWVISPHGYSGYSSDASPMAEPFAYGSHFICRAVVNNAITGNRDATVPVVYGPHYWANGTTPNADGLYWDCADMDQSDGIHWDSTTGRRKAASVSWEYYRADAIARRWLYAPTIEELLCADCF